MRSEKKRILILSREEAKVEILERVQEEQRAGGEVEEGEDAVRLLPSASLQLSRLSKVEN